MRNKVVDVLAPLPWALLVSHPLAKGDLLAPVEARLHLSQLLDLLVHLCVLAAQLLDFLLCLIKLLRIDLLLLAASDVAAKVQSLKLLLRFVESGLQHLELGFD